MRKSYKHLLGILAVVIGLLFLVSIYLYFFFPYNRVRSYLKKEAAQKLGVDLELGPMRMWLFEGLSIGAISLTDPLYPEKILQLDALVIDYDIWALLDNKLRINRIVLDSPKLDLRHKDGAWNLERVLNRLKEEKPPPPDEKPQPEEKPELAGLPIEVYLERILIRNPTLYLEKPGELELDFSGIDIEGRVSLEKESSHISINLSTSKAGSNFEVTLPKVSLITRPHVDLRIQIDDFQIINAEGQFRLDETKIRLEEDIPPLSLTARIKAKVDLSRGTANISSLDISLNQAQKLTLSAEINRLFSAPKIKAVVEDLNLDLGLLLEIAKTYIPDMSLQGRAVVSGLQLEGGLDEKMSLLPLRLFNGRGRLVGIMCKTKEIDIQGLSANLELKEMIFEEITPRAMLLSMDVSTNKASGPGFNAEGIKGNLTVESGGKNRNVPAKLALKTDIRSIEISDITLAGLKVEMDGDIKHPDLTESNIDIKIKLDKISQTGDTPVSATGFAAEVRLDEMLFLRGKLKKISAVVDFRNRLVTHPKVQVINIKGNITATAYGEELENNLVRADIEKMRVILDFPQTGRQEISIGLSGTAGGNFREMDIIVQAFKFGVDDFWEGNYSGKVSGPSEFSISGLSTLDLKKLKIPPALKESVGELSTNGKLELFSRIQSIPPDTQDTKSPSPPPALTFDNKIIFKNTGLKIEKPQGTLKNLNTDLDVKGRFSSPDGLEDITVSGSVGLGAVDFPGFVSMDEGKMIIDIKTSDQNFSDTTLALDIKGKGVRLLEADIKIPLVDILLKAESQIPKKTARLKQMVLDIPDKVRLKGGGEIKEWGKLFNLNLQCSLMDLNWVLGQIPEAIRKKIPLAQLAGSANIEIMAQGKRPTDEQIKNLDIPFDLTGKIMGDGISFTYPAKKISANNLSFNSDLSYLKGAVNLSGNLNIDRLAPVDELSPLGLTYKIYLDDGLDRLRIGEGTRLTLADKQISLEIAGEVGGLIHIINPQTPINPQTVLDELSVHLGTSLVWSSEKEIDLPGNYRIAGRVENELKIDVNPGESFQVEGKLMLHDFQFNQADKLSLQNITLKFPYRKKLYLSPVPEKEIVKTPVAIQGAFSSLGRFSRTRNNLHIQRFEMGGVEAQNIFADVVLKRDSFGAERFGMDFFGGGVGGALLLFSGPDNHIIQFSTEFAGIGFDSVMPQTYRTGNPEDTIAGNIKLTIYMDRRGENEKVDLKRIDLRLRITHIGYNSLNQLLLFLDPQESNPSIISARDTLKLATPVMVDFQIAHGNLSLALELESKVLGGARFSLPVLNRIPLDILKNFDNIAKQINRLAPIKQVMEILSAKGVKFDENQKLEFIQ